jgi:hypothetical protein
MYISSPRIDIGKKKIQKILIVFVVIRKFYDLMLMDLFY